MSFCSLAPQYLFLLVPQLQLQPLPQHRELSQGSPGEKAQSPGELALDPRSWARSCRGWWWCSVVSRTPSAPSCGTRPWSWGPSIDQTGPRTAHTSCGFPAQHACSCFICPFSATLPPSLLSCAPSRPYLFAPLVLCFLPHSLSSISVLFLPHPV